MSGNSQKSRLKDLIARGKEQGYLTYAEVNDHLPEDIADPDQVEDIIRMINDMGIQVMETAPDADELLMTDGDSTADEAAAAEAAAALAAVESDAGRTSSLQQAWEALALDLPNLPAADVPDGRDEHDNVELRRWGTP
ncbi:MAG: RNA polymerase sigma factor region1.1 domain-containing protein, partial [Pseudomonadota bacterium]|nr:RNA polymerase sigma factor region1.1 domain-containing protein [Pseudomonadota bacterium]